MKRFHSIFFQDGQMVDIIPSREDFSRYKLVVIPHMIVTDPAFVQRLKAYVAAGGVAVVTYRTAVKDRNNNLTFGKVLPVDCDDLLGLVVEETESVQEWNCIPLAGPNSGATAGVFRDMSSPTTAQVLYRYGDTFYRDYAAVTCNRYGDGAAYYLGTTPDRETLTQLLEEAMIRAGITPLVSYTHLDVYKRQV